VTLTALAYLPAVLGMMTVGIVVPFVSALGRDLLATPAELGLAIALFSLPTAVLATIGGNLIDRHGVRRSMLFAGGASAIASTLASNAHSLWTFDCAMLIAGAGFGGICVAAPCLLIATLNEVSRIRAMSFLSTFAPSGYAAGLLLAVPFIDDGDWRLAMQVHAVLMTLIVIAMARLIPHIEAAATDKAVATPGTFSSILGALRDARILRLSIAVALPNAVSYGTGLAAPSYLARVHDLSLAASSATVALAKIAAMIIGGLSMGYLLSRAARTSLLFAAMAVTGALAQIVLFLPASGVTLATAALILWLFAFGGMAGGAMTLLPLVAGDCTRAATASGVVNQAISLCSFAVPSIWLTLTGGMQFIALAVTCLLVSVIALPGAASCKGLQVSRAADSSPDCSRT